MGCKYLNIEYILFHVTWSDTTSSFSFIRAKASATKEAVQNPDTMDTLPMPETQITTPSPVHPMRPLPSMSPPPILKPSSLLSIPTTACGEKGNQEETAEEEKVTDDECLEVIEQGDEAIEIKSGEENVMSPNPKQELQIDSQWRLQDDTMERCNVPSPPSEKKPEPETHAGHMLVPPAKKAKITQKVSKPMPVQHPVQSEEPTACAEHAKGLEQAIESDDEKNKGCFKAGFVIGAWFRFQSVSFAQHDLYELLFCKRQSALDMCMQITSHFFGTQITSRSNDTGHIFEFKKKKPNGKQKHVYHACAPL